jgi:hypothetical protein
MALNISMYQVKSVGQKKNRGKCQGALRMTIMQDESKQVSCGFRYAIYMMGVLMLANNEIISSTQCGKSC